jgi:hypothetical protein
LTGFSDFFIIFSLVNDCGAFVRRIKYCYNYILFTAHQTIGEDVKLGSYTIFMRNRGCPKCAFPGAGLKKWFLE